MQLIRDSEVPLFAPSATQEAASAGAIGTDVGEKVIHLLAHTAP